MHFVFFWLGHTPPCGRLADRNRNRNVKSQLDNATPKMGSKCFGKFFIKSLHFLLGRPYVNTNSLKSFKFLHKVNLHCRKCKNVQNSLLKQIFCKVLSLNKTSGLHSYISNHICKVCTSLAQMSKKLKIRCGLGFDRNRNRNDFVAVTATARRGMGTGEGRQNLGEDGIPNFLH